MKLSEKQIEAIKQTGLLKTRQKKLTGGELHDSAYDALSNERLMSRVSLLSRKMGPTTSASEGSLARILLRPWNMTTTEFLTT
jgi:hypothetical protein